MINEEIQFRKTKYSYSRTRAMSNEYKRQYSFFIEYKKHQEIHSGMFLDEHLFFFKIQGVKVWNKKRYLRTIQDIETHEVYFICMIYNIFISGVS